MTDNHDELGILGRTIHDRYLIKQVISAGGFGYVYLAHNTKLNKPVAIKFLSLEMSKNPDIARRFIEEAQKIAGLRHRNIVNVHDMFEAGDNLPAHYIMEHLGGGSLKEKLKGSKYTLPETVEFVKKVSAALHEIHLSEIVHRDIKPSNILFDERGEPRIIDFGIAKDLRPAATRDRTTVIMGSPPYMSPEQSGGSSSVNAKSDQYSLALVVFQMLTGQLPFDVEENVTGIRDRTGSQSRRISKTYSTYAIAHMAGIPLDVRDLRKDLPPALSKVFSRAFSKEAEDRYPDILEFAKGFEKATNNRALPIPLIAAATAVAGLAILAAIIVGSGGSETNTPTAISVVFSTSTPDAAALNAAQTIESQQSTQTAEALNTTTAQLFETSTMEAIVRASTSETQTISGDDEATEAAVQAVVLATQNAGLMLTQAFQLTGNAGTLASVEAGITGTAVQLALEFQQTRNAQETRAAEDRQTALAVTNQVEATALMAIRMAEAAQTATAESILTATSGAALITRVAEANIMASASADAAASAIALITNTAAAQIAAAAQTQTAEQRGAVELTSSKETQVSLAQTVSAQTRAAEAAQVQTLVVQMQITSSAADTATVVANALTATARITATPTFTFTPRPTNTPSSTMTPSLSYLELTATYQSILNLAVAETLTLVAQQTEFVQRAAATIGAIQTLTSTHQTGTPIPTATPFGGGTGLISFSSNRVGNQDIWTLNLDTGELQNLTEWSQSDEDHSEWSPDGSQIVFSSNKLANRNQIYLMNADGTNVRQLTNLAGDNQRATWSPDGTRIAFDSTRDGNSEIYVMNVDGSNLINVTNHPGLDFFPAWSPDGTRIAFTSDRDGNNEIYIVDFDGSNLVRLTENEFDDAAIAWNPSYDIAFRSDLNGPFDIYLINVQTREVEQLTADEPADAAPAWSPDGTFILFSARVDDSEVYLMRRNGENIRNLTNLVSSDEARPSWQPR